LSKIYTADEVRQLLRLDVERAGGVNAWARQKVINQPLVSRTLSGHRALSPCILKAIGARRIINYTIDNVGNHD
jgi:hypothetical protein